VIAATMYVMFQLYRRGPSRSLPADAGLRASLDFHLRELERQRYALHTVWAWYLLPFVPGFVAAFVVRVVDRGFASAIPFGAGFVLIFFGVWTLNQWAARKIGRSIQELKEQP